MRRDSVLEQTEEYIGRLEGALDLPQVHARRVVDEVRGDLVAAVASRCRQGMGEAEAVEEVLRDLADPEEMAAQISKSVPPLSHGGVRAVRYLLGAGLMVYAAWLLWGIRAWGYGLELFPRRAVIWVVVLAFTAAIWPAIVWRRNWLHGAVPFGVVVGLFFLGNFLGVGGEQAAVDPGAPPEWPPVADGWGLADYLMLAGVAAGVVYLSWQIQRRRQRLAVVALGLLALLVVEGAFQVEEHVFRRQRDRLAQLVEEHPGEGGSAPSREALAAVGDPLLDADNVHYRPARGAAHFTLFWDRPLSPGFAIVYWSGDGRVWIND